MLPLPCGGLPLSGSLPRWPAPPSQLPAQAGAAGVAAAVAGTRAADATRAVAGATADAMGTRSGAACDAGFAVVGTATPWPGAGARSGAAGVLLKPTQEATTYASVFSPAAWVGHSNPAAISSCSSRSSTSCPMPSSYHSGLRGRESARSLFRAGSVRISS
jgi:hypothetical protein